MNEHDRKLEDWARGLSCHEWDMIHPEEAETKEGKDILQAIQNHLYHKEEYFSGLA